MTDSKHEDLAAFVGCTAADVEAAFGNLAGFALWAANRSRTGAAREDAKALQAIADDLDKAIRRIEALPEHDGGEFIMPMDGLPTPGDLCRLRTHFRSQAAVAAHFTHPDAYPSPKGRSEQARVIAEAVARLFVATGRTVGKGTSQLDGEPTSKYGQAVKKALDLYGVRANWRQPAKDGAASVQANTN